MNTHTAIPAHVGEDGVWLDFVSPTTGKQASIHLTNLINNSRGIVAEVLTEWAQEQARIRAVHNPPPAVNAEERSEAK